MDLEIQNLSRLSHKEIGNLNTPITRKEIKSVIKDLPAKKKILDLIVSLMNPTRNLKN